MGSAICCREELVLLTLTYLSFKIFNMHQNLYKTLKKKNEMHNESPLNCFWTDLTRSVE